MLLKLAERTMLLVETIVLAAQVVQMSAIVRITAILAIAAMVTITAAMASYRHFNHVNVIEDDTRRLLEKEQRPNCVICATKERYF